MWVASTAVAFGFTLLRLGPKLLKAAPKLRHLGSYLRTEYQAARERRAVGELAELEAREELALKRYAAARNFFAGRVVTEPIAVVRVRSKVEGAFILVGGVADDLPAYTGGATAPLDERGGGCEPTPLGWVVPLGGDRFAAGPGPVILRLPAPRQTSHKRMLVGVKYHQGARIYGQSRQR